VVKNVRISSRNALSSSVRCSFMTARLPGGREMMDGIYPWRV
jgi:hypothetical protein